jgi:hypothetical protein
VAQGPAPTSPTVVTADTLTDPFGLQPVGPEAPDPGDRDETEEPADSEGEPGQADQEPDSEADDETAEVAGQPDQSGRRALGVAGPPGDQLEDDRQQRQQQTADDNHRDEPGEHARRDGEQPTRRRARLRGERARPAAHAGVADRPAALEFVNGGGTGSLEATASEEAVSELGAGSGLYSPGLFDTYRGFRHVPAAFFVLAVVRKPAPDVATVLGGGRVASGASGRDRLPTPAWPTGLRLSGTEGAGEVQTPLVGPGAADLDIVDRVWFRHAKAGELCEHVNGLHLVRGGEVVDVVPTYRGEGRAFL